MKLVLSSSNKDKIYEIQNILGLDYQVILKSDIGLGDLQVEENGSSLKENAYIKAKAIYDIQKTNVIADDTGLFVQALGGKPGVHTARFAGPDATYDDNNSKMLETMSKFPNKEDRKAKFVTVICFITEAGEVYFVEGRLEGFIADQRRGDKNKFGYNPIFEEGLTGLTLAEMDDEMRLTINHRYKALIKLKKLLGEIK